MKYLAVIKKQGITALNALGHLVFFKPSILFRAFVTFSQTKNNKVLLHKESFFSYSSQNKERASSYFI